ncbi:MAG: transcriptional repressor, partial [Cytophagales bacterium CG18_big_fil_WC_8_21_14_2_50_42_9]
MAGTTRTDIRARIVAVGLKATLQRIIIFESLLNLHDAHPTAEEVFQQLKTAHPGISLGTVYKTLDSFVEANLVKRVLSDSKRRFDVNEQPHGHIYCTNTKEIIDYT